MLRLPTNLTLLKCFTAEITLLESFTNKVTSLIRLIPPHLRSRLDFYHQKIAILIWSLKRILHSSLHFTTAKNMPLIRSYINKSILQINFNQQNYAFDTFYHSNLHCWLHLFLTSKTTPSSISLPTNLHSWHQIAFRLDFCSQS